MLEWIKILERVGKYNDKIKNQKDERCIANNDLIRLIGALTNIVFNPVLKRSKACRTVEA